MATLTAILQALVSFLPFVAKLLPVRAKPAGPIEPVKDEPWVEK